jgi:hypothetical protein
MATSIEVTGAQVTITMPLTEARELTGELLWVREDDESRCVKLWEALDGALGGGDSSD